MSRRYQTTFPCWEGWTNPYSNSKSFDVSAVITNDSEIASKQRITHCWRKLAVKRTQQAMSSKTQYLRISLSRDSSLIVRILKLTSILKKAVLLTRLRCKRIWICMKVGRPRLSMLWINWSQSWGGSRIYSWKEIWSIISTRLRVKWVNAQYSTKNCLWRFKHSTGCTTHAAY